MTSVNNESNTKPAEVVPVVDAAAPSQDEQSVKEVTETVGELKIGEDEVNLAPPDDDHTVSHPLENAWWMYYAPPKSSKPSNNWEDAVKKILEFSSVEDFWWYVFLKILFLFFIFRVIYIYSSSSSSSSSVSFSLHVALVCLTRLVCICW